MGFWTDKLAEQQRPLPPPQIPPQAPPAVDDTFSDLVAQAKAAMQMATPAHSVAERFGHAPGEGISITARKPGPAAEAQSDLLDLSPQERAMVVHLGIEGGKFDTVRAKAARDNAAEVAEAVREHAWDITVDTTPRRARKTQISGFTPGIH
jgi:hypothetical protein